MTAGSRLRIAALMTAFTWAFAAAPLPAQDVAAQPANNSAETVGPPQLRDFSLGGTVTRRPDATTTTTTTTTRPEPRAPVPTTTAPEPRQTAPTAQPEAEPAPSASGAATLQLPDAPASSQPTEVQASPGPALGSQPGVVPPSLPPSASIPVEGGPSLLPWLLGALVLGGGALYFALRPRRRVALAGPDLEQAQPLERAAPPEPAPAPVPPPAPAGMVSTRLRPWLEVEFVPERLIFDGKTATIRFDVTIRNSGNAPARDVLVEGAMFNAGTAQDEEIGAFFAHPVGKGERLAEILPLRSVALRSAVSMPAEQMRVFDVGGRKLFVPLIGLSALYHWGGGDGQTSASYLIGRDAKAERMGPFFLDLGPRVFRTVAARQHLLKVRK